MNGADDLFHSWKDEQRTLTTDGLTRKVELLEAELRALRNSQQSHSPSVPSFSGKDRRFKNSDPLEDALWTSLRPSNVTPRTKITNWSDIVLPSRSGSSYLIVFDRIWNSWVHYALEYPRFQTECDRFMDALEGGASLEAYDPFWLATYFSTICVWPLFKFGLSPLTLTL